MAKRIRAVLVHGFWESEQSWQPVMEVLKSSEHELDLFVPNLFIEGPLSSRHSFYEWSQNLISAKRKLFGAEPILLVGYSLGGRLALHAASIALREWSGLLVLSTNPGLQVDVLERRSWEAHWTQKFRVDSWERLESDWNNQMVFKGSDLLKRKGVGESVNRKLLALSFSNWSLTNHQFDERSLRKIADYFSPGQLQFWYGESDQKYVKLAETLQKLSIGGEQKIIPQAGHRLHLDAAPLVANQILTMSEHVF